MELTLNDVKNRRRKYYIIYITTNTDTGKQYVGQHLVRPTNIREIDDPYLGSGKRLKIAIERFGAESFKRKVLHRVTTQTEANKLERKEIKERNLQSIGYNIANGGQEGSHCPRELLKQGWVKRKRAGRGEAWNKGKKCPQLSERAKKQWQNKNSRDKLSKSMTGKKHSEETKAKMRLAKKRYYQTHDSPLKGRKQPKISKKMIGNTNWKNITTEQHKEMGKKAWETRRKNLKLSEEIKHGFTHRH